MQYFPWLYANCGLIWLNPWDAEFLSFSSHILLGAKADSSQSFYSLDHKIKPSSPPRNWASAPYGSSFSLEESRGPCKQVKYGLARCFDYLPAAISLNSEQAFPVWGSGNVPHLYFYSRLLYWSNTCCCYELISLNSYAYSFYLALTCAWERLDPLWSRLSPMMRFHQAVHWLNCSISRR